MAEVAQLKRKYQLLEAQVHSNQSIGSIRSNHHHHHHHHHHQQRLNRSCRFGSHFNNHCNNEMRERFGHKKAVDIENDAEPDEESRLGDELSVGTNSTGSVASQQNSTVSQISIRDEGSSRSQASAASAASLYSAMSNVSQGSQASNAT